MNNENETLKNIRKLLDDGKCDEALEICNSYSLSSSNIDYFKALILLKIGKKNNDKVKLRQSIAICNSYSQYDNGFKSIKYEATLLLQGIEIRKTRNNFPHNPAVNKIYTRVYYNDITADAIKEADIPQFRKEILLLAYYEKNNRTMGLKYIKELMKKYHNDKTKLRLINTLYDKFSRKDKKIYYNLGAYGNIINATLDLNYKKSADNSGHIVSSDSSDKVTITQLENKSEKTKMVTNLNVNSYVSCQGKRINSRYDIIETGNYKYKNKGQLKTEDKVLIKDLFSTEILEVQKLLYLKMQSTNIKNRQDAIKAFDNFELLIEKDVDDRLALDKTLKVLKILNLIDDDSEKIKKYIK